MTGVVKVSVLAFSLKKSRKASWLSSFVEQQFCARWSERPRIAEVMFASNVPQPSSLVKRYSNVSDTSAQSFEAQMLEACLSARRRSGEMTYEMLRQVEMKN